MAADGEMRWEEGDEKRSMRAGRGDVDVSMIGHVEKAVGGIGGVVGNRKVDQTSVVVVGCKSFWLNCSLFLWCSRHKEILPTCSIKPYHR